MVHGAPDFYSRVRERGVQTYTNKRSGDIESGEYETMYDQSDMDVELVHLEFSGNEKLIWITVQAYNSDGTLGDSMNITDNEGVGFQAISPQKINTYESIMFLELEYDATNEKYKYGLGYPIRFAYGCKIVLGHNIGSTKKACLFIALLERG